MTNFKRSKAIDIRLLLYNLINSNELSLRAARVITKKRVLSQLKQRGLNAKDSTGLLYSTLSHSLYLYQKSMKKIARSCIVMLLISCQQKNTDVKQVENKEPVEITTSKNSGINDFGKQVNGHYNKEEDSWISEDPFYESVNFGGGDYASIYRLTDNEDEPHLGLIDKKGKIVVSTKYSGLSIGFVNGFCEVSLDKKGMVDDKGKEILPPIYDWIDLAKDNLFIINKDGKNGFADATGKVLVRPKYQGASYAGDGLFFYMKEPQRWGLKNFKEEVVVQPEFTSTSEFINGKVVLQKDGGEEYIVYSNGKVVKK